jgi:hypothetical protein
MTCAIIVEFEIDEFEKLVEHLVILDVLYTFELLLY